MKLYEGMYIVSEALGAEGWEKVEETIKETISRFEGEIVRMRKWGDRVLAFPIKKEDKGVYVLTHFTTEPGNIVKMENRIKIMPEILRVLFLRIEEKHADELFAKEAGDEGVLRSLEDEDDDDRGRGGRRPYNRRGEGNRDSRSRTEEQAEPKAEEAPASKEDSEKKAAESEPVADSELKPEPKPES